MNNVGNINNNDNKLRYWYDSFENILATHSKMYAFNVDLLIECVTVIPYYSQWSKLLNKTISDIRHTVHINHENNAQCIIIGLCFRCLPKMSISNLRSTLESKIYNRSNNKQWCSGLISILDLLYDTIQINDNEDTKENDESKDNESSIYLKLNKIIKDFPTKYEKLGDCVLFPSSFESTLKCIKSILSTTKMNELYEILCQYFKCDQIGLQQAIRMYQSIIYFPHVNSLLI